MKKPEDKKPAHPKPAPAPGDGSGGSGEGAQTALEALIRKRKLAETPDGEPLPPDPAPS
jgi:hypothetical protein